MKLIKLVQNVVEKPYQYRSDGWRLEKPYTGLQIWEGGEGGEGGGEREERREWFLAERECPPLSLDLLRRPATPAGERCGIHGNREVPHWNVILPGNSRGRELITITTDA